jgi:hypothetical protein
VHIRLFDMSTSMTALLFVVSVNRLYAIASWHLHQAQAPEVPGVACGMGRACLCVATIYYCTVPFGCTSVALRDEYLCYRDCPQHPANFQSSVRQGPLEHVCHSRQQQARWLHKHSHLSTD